ncbi:alpha-tocopherol transfer protein-like [Spodoptera litura]|uniref:Alpha-tocopherol transfer protein-like n=1 Tax=Spodoptera litura TaxID=69820 RepID=A0A9J7EJN4_SPOLT|nr:alpha-tocopherol transfer protein-like [Spodoptera litura]
MELLYENQILRMPPGTVENIRKIHDLDKPERLDEAIKILDDWIQKQEHLVKKDFSRMYLEKTLISCKGSVEKAKKQIDRLCTMKTLNPKFFTKTNVKAELQNVLRVASLIPLPTLTDDYYRVLLVKIRSFDLTSESFMLYFQYCLILCEYIKANDYVNGFIIIYDCRELNMFDVVSKMSTVELQQFITILIEGYGARMKSIHMLTNSKAIELIINTVKQFISEKVGNRMYVQRTLEDLHKDVPKNILPVEYGGTEKSLDIMQEEMVKELSKEEYVDYVKMMFNARTEEGKRNAGKFNEEYLGMPGSFRALSVD